MLTGVVLLAAGTGQRMKSKMPKQFVPVHGQPLFMFSLQVFARVPTVREIVIVCRPADRKKIEKHVSRLSHRKKIIYADGGAFRGESVRNGLVQLSQDLDVILVHDSARPLISIEVVQRVEKGALKHGVALAAWPLGDSLKKVGKKENFVGKTISRAGLWLAQTPQGFRRKIAVQCLLAPTSEATDDVELAERKGYPVKLVPGAAHNFKVTYQEDLRTCRKLLAK